MNSQTTKRSVFSKIRGDVSALLIIAFVFQLVWPVVVLASTTDQESAFEQDLRASICRVHFDDPVPNDAQKTATDDFVCEFCVLCTLQAIPHNDSLPEYVRLDPLAGLPQVTGATDGTIPAKIFLNGEPSPRSPPA